MQELNRSAARRPSANKQRGFRGLAEPPLVPRVSPGVPKCCLGAPPASRGPPQPGGALPTPEKHSPGWGNRSPPRRECSRVFPVITSYYRSPRAVMSAGKTIHRSFCPQGILAGALCSAGPPTASPFPFVLLLAALRNHSLWKHLSAMDWVEYIQSSRQ